MKITEILNIPNQDQHSVNLSQFDINNAKQVAFAERIPVFYSSAKNLELYFLKKDDDIISFILGSKTTINDNEYLEIHRTWVDPEHRMKGYATALYSALYNKLNKKLLSDEKQTPIIQRIWKNVDTVLNTETGEIKTRSQISDSELYVDGSDLSRESKRYRLIKENFINLLTRPYDLEHNKIIGDNLIATHPDNNGKYD